MANNRKELINSIKAFLDSEEKCMLITGTHQYQKHMVTIAVLNKYLPGAHVLFRTNAMQNLTESSFLGELIDKQPKMGQRFRIENNVYEADTFNNKGSWHKTSYDLDVAIIYPIDAIVRGSVKMDCIDDLFRDKDIKKIFLISWTDAGYDYSVLDRYVDRHAVFDAEEEDLEYHKRVLGYDE